MEHGGGGHEIAGHKLAHFAGLTFNLDTLYMTWITMGIVILLAVAATRRIALVPRGWQNFLEMVVTYLADQIDSTMGPKGRKLTPLIITLFLFLLVGNELGMIPGFTSPTSDINTTAGLALMIILLVHVLGVMNQGAIRYFKHFFEPSIPFVIINIVEELAKPITLAFRLFGNILAGEIMLMVLMSLVPFLVPLPWMAFSVFIGAVQALIFTMLSISYLASSLKEDRH